MKPENPASRAWTIAAIPVALAGITTLLVNDLAPLHWKPRIGYGLIGFAVLMSLMAVWTTRRATTARRGKIERGRIIVQSLIGGGDRLHHLPGAGLGQSNRAYPFEPSVEEWRTAVGEKLAHSPFKRGTGDWVLTQDGNRFSDPLRRLREIEANLESWISED